MFTPSRNPVVTQGIGCSRNSWASFSRRLRIALKRVWLRQRLFGMGEFRISYLVDYPEYVPQLAEWSLQHWKDILRDETRETRIEKLKTHLNRDELPIAWVAHGNGQPFGTAALRVHDLEEREDLTPWLGGVLVGGPFRRRGIGEALCRAVEEEARSRGIATLYLFTLDKQTWYSRLGWSDVAPCLWRQRPGIIMSKQLQTTRPRAPGNAT